MSTHSRKRATINTIKNQGRWQKPQGPKKHINLGKGMFRIEFRIDDIRSMSYHQQDVTKKIKYLNQVIHNSQKVKNINKNKKNKHHS